MTTNREIERIRLRCVCKEDGCWRWAGSKNRNGIPTIGRIIDGVKKCMSARRWVVQVATGKPLRKSDRIITTCETVDCLNPAHLRKTTPSAIQRIVNARDPGLQMRRGIAIKAAWNRKGHGFKLDQQKADYARDPSRPSKDVAAELGCSVTLVNYIRAGRVWRQDGNPFAGLLAANDSARRSAA